ncbi:Lipopolysaccharide choline phosphotransferase protein [Fasciola gigantica]|uniref:Lipopolysaccharide choline phosphotransferase protein n=1 Tax=Fasciola gigantica TaxID=46835 RepID=A0A504YMF1_FASGI|nr:Lipopolysaccharide choline phosphotransferase protein [Fasciola gigantica]
MTRMRTYYQRISDGVLIEILWAMKITLFIAAAVLVGVTIDNLSNEEMDPELLNLGSFYPTASMAPCAEQSAVDNAQAFLEIHVVQPYKNTSLINMLPDLTELDWPKPLFATTPAGLLLPNKTVYPLPKPFEPVMSKGQISLSRKLLNLFSDFMFSHGYGDRFWLNGGTLVGSYHHHDFIPWDDDIDVLADADLRPTIQSFLEQLAPEYEWYAMWERDKLFTKSLNASDNHLDLEYSRTTSDKGWAWPFLDIGYYRSGPTQTCVYLWRPGQGECFENSAIFPLLYRPFGKEWYPTPCNTPSYLRSVYKMRSSCVTFGYSHIFEVGSSYARVPCYTLAGKYAFTQHCSVTTVPWYSTDALLNKTFIINQERLVIKTAVGWKVVHTLNLPLKNEVSKCKGYGLPEPR